MIRYYVGKPKEADEAAIKLPEKAKELQKVWQPQLETWKKHDPEMASHASNARFSVSDGEWSGVSSSVASALNGMHTHWRERYAAAERVCPRLGLGEKHPDVDKALDDLSKYKSSAKDTVTQLKKDYNAWLREVRKLRELSEKDRDELRAVMCEAGEYDVERRTLEVADKWAGQLSSVHGSITGQADRLRDRSNEDRLEKYKGSKEVREGVAKHLEIIDKLRNYELLGANNPKIKARLAWGNKRHEEIANGIGCQYKEAKVDYCDNAIRPGSGCRADCVVVSGSTCRVVEVKPDSKGGRDEGEKQVKAYLKGFVDWHREDRKKLLETYPEMKSCEADGKLRIDYDVVYYDFCSGLVRDELGVVLQEISSDVSENE